MGGGTGSGLGSLLVAKLREEYLERGVCTYSVVPSPLLCNVVVEPYNAIFTFNHLIEYSHQTFCMDNEALHNVSTKVLKLSHPSFDHLNSLVAMVMAGVTAPVRFAGPSTTDYRKLRVNLIPFPR